MDGRDLGMSLIAHGLFFLFLFFFPHDLGGQGEIESSEYWR